MWAGTTAHLADKGHVPIGEMQRVLRAVPAVPYWYRPKGRHFADYLSHDILNFSCMAILESSTCKAPCHRL